MPHVEGKVTSYEVINAALDKPELIATSNAQSAARGMYNLLMERPNDVPVGHAMWKMLQKLPKEELAKLDKVVTDQFAKFEKAGVAATTAVFTMSAPRVPTESPKGRSAIVEQLSSQLEAAKNGSPDKPGSKP